MARLVWKPPFVKKSISFPLDQLHGLRRIAIDDGHGNVSRVVQELLESDLKRRYGRDWRTEAETGRAPDTLDRAYDDIVSVAVGGSTDGANSGYGDWLRSQRIEHGLSQQRLGEAVGIDRAHVSQIESGKIALPSEHLREKIASVLNATRVGNEVAA